MVTTVAMAMFLRFWDLKVCGCSTASLNPCKDLLQIFTICLPQEDLKLIWVLVVSGNKKILSLKVCGYSTAETHVWIFTKFSAYIYPKRI